MRLLINSQPRMFRDFPDYDEHQRRLMLTMWKQGLDTLAIAYRLNLLEWQVANELPRLREAEKQGRV